VSVDMAHSGGFFSSHYLRKDYERAQVLFFREKVFFLFACWQELPQKSLRVSLRGVFSERVFHLRGKSELEDARSVVLGVCGLWFPSRFVRWCDEFLRKAPRICPNVSLDKTPRQKKKTGPNPRIGDKKYFCS